MMPLMTATPATTTTPATTADLDYSMWIPNSFEWEEVASLARAADDGPWRTIWYADHYMPNSGAEERLDGDIYEAWAVLAGIAAITNRVRLGPLVSPTSVHHPALLANRAATIDRMSNGRFVLGLGAGWQINEHAAYGIELEPPSQRVARFAEAIEVTRSLLDNERTNFEGSFYQFDDAPCQPAPVQAKLPLLVGTSGPRMLRLTARFAQEWNTWGSPDLAAQNMDLFRIACEREGIDPASIHASVQALVFLVDDPDKQASLRDKSDMDRTIVGNPTQIRESMQAYADAGFDEFILLGQTLGRTPSERLEAYERFVAEVIEP